MQVVPNIAMVETYARLLLIAPHSLFRSHFSVISVLQKLILCRYVYHIWAVSFILSNSDFSIEKITIKDLSAFIMSTLLITLLEIAVMSLTKLCNLIISGLYYASAWYFTKRIKINYGTSSHLLLKESEQVFGSLVFSVCASL